MTYRANALRNKEVCLDLISWTIGLGANDCALYLNTHFGRQGDKSLGVNDSMSHRY